MPNRSRSAVLARPLRRRALELLSASFVDEAVASLMAADVADPSVESAILIGECLAEHGQVEAAEQTLRTAWERAKSSGRPKERRSACVALVNLFAGLGRSTDAAQFEQLAISASLDADGEVDSSVRVSMATRQMLAGHAVEARGLLSMAGQATADERALHGVLSLVEGDLRRAGEWLYQAYRGHKEAGDEVAAATDLQFVGMTLRCEGRYSEAAVCHAAAAEIWTPEGECRAAAEAEHDRHDCRRVALARSAEPALN